MTEDIETFLGTVSEATAKTIAAGIGLPHLDVVKAINKMYAGGKVEREKRAGGGSEYVYWLARGAAPVPPAGAAAGRRSVARRGNCQPAAVGRRGRHHPARHRGTARRGRTPHRRARRRAAEGGHLARERSDARSAHRRLTLGPVGAGAPLFVTVGRNCKAAAPRIARRPSAAAARSCAAKGIRGARARTGRPDRARHGVDAPITTGPHHDHHRYHHAHEGRAQHHPLR